MRRRRRSFLYPFLGSCRTDQSYAWNRSNLFLGFRCGGRGAPWERQSSRELHRTPARLLRYSSYDRSREFVAFAKVSFRPPSQRLGPNLSPVVTVLLHLVILTELESPTKERCRRPPYRHGQENTEGTSADRTQPFDRSRVIRIACRCQASENPVCCNIRLRRRTQPKSRCGIEARPSRRSHVVSAKIRREPRENKVAIANSV